MEGWSVRRSRAWRRGRMLPIWQGSIRIRPLHRNQVSKTLYLSPARLIWLPEPGVAVGPAGHGIQQWTETPPSGTRRGLTQQPVQNGACVATGFSSGLKPPVHTGWRLGRGACVATGFSTGLKPASSSDARASHKKNGAPALSLTPHPFPPNPFAVRGQPGALALQLVSSSSSSSGGSH